MKKVKATYLASLIGYRSNKTLASIEINHITIDSRKVHSQSMFVALKGESLDGHDFIIEAIQMGSPLILAAVSQKIKVLKAIQGHHVQVLYVEDPLRALQQMAKKHIQNSPLLKKIGITGSVGKTTTKEILASILRESGETAKTIGNYNSEIGLAISAFEIEENSQYAVFEMGVDHIGEMKTMVDIYSPHIGIITNIGLSHIGKMGSLENIAKEKGDIFHPSIEYSFMEEKSIYRSSIAQQKEIKISPFGFSSMPYITNINSLHLDGWSFFYKGEKVHLKGIGKHTLIDALGAIKIAENLDVKTKEIVQGLHEYKAMDGRSKVTKGKVTLIEDWYNSSVDSTSLILNCLKKAPNRGTKRVVLGSMKEMGSFTYQAHQEVAQAIKKSQFEHLYLYGKEMYTTYASLKALNSGAQLFYTDEYEQLEQFMLEETKRGDLVLLKGSRMMAMERLVPAMRSIS
ncbi:MAG: UDP-N-acetylmuramoyl-tripeptide--D-alanyl-D-alanine ligase [Spirochaetia bacterium]|nr:UDP-N-acetylmuramoyl-tripeptide--D-alanyl-D-alanine ligase [Spirochaetia bacterium]